MTETTETISMVLLLVLALTTIAIMMWSWRARPWRRLAVSFCCHSCSPPLRFCSGCAVNENGGVFVRSGRETWNHISISTSTRTQKSERGLGCPQAHRRGFWISLLAGVLDRLFCVFSIEVARVWFVKTSQWTKSLPWFLWGEFLFAIFTYFAAWLEG